jgi:hypothetical protein
LVLSAAGVIALYSMLRIFSKAAKKIAVGAEGMNRKREAETKKACRLGKPLMFFDVSYLMRLATWLRG